MGIPDRAFIEQYKKLYPEMDVGMIHFFAGTMMVFHEIPIMMDAYFHKHLGLTKGGFMVMIQLIVAPAEGTSISEMLNFHKVSSATMTGIIDTLERDGLLERIQSSTDRRKVNVRATPRGMELMNRILPDHHENVRRIIGGFSESDKKEMGRLLRKLHQGVGDFLAGGGEQKRGDEEP